MGWSGNGDMEAALQMVRPPQSATLRAPPGRWDAFIINLLSSNRARNHEPERAQSDAMPCQFRKSVNMPES